MELKIYDIIKYLYKNIPYCNVLHVQCHYRLEIKQRKLLLVMKSKYTKTKMSFAVNVLKLHVCVIYKNSDKATPV